MSKTAGQIVGGVIGGVIGFISGGPMGAVKGYMIGSSIGGMIDPPPGPDLKGPTLDDKSFNSAAYGVSLATLHGTIAHTGSIIYLENNEYKAVAKKQKTGGKGGGPEGSYTTTTYFATFAVAVGEAMPGSKLRRIWAGGKLIYSVGDTVDVDTLLQSKINSGFMAVDESVLAEPALKWRYYDGTQTDSDSRMEAVLGVGNCPSYEGTAYIIFYDFDLTNYGNGLQGCPIKVEVIADFEPVNDDLPFQKIYESVSSYPAYVYDGVWGWLENSVSVRALTPVSAMFFERGLIYNGTVSTYHSFNMQVGWNAWTSTPYDGNIHGAAGLTFSNDRNWHEFLPSAGVLPNTVPGWDVSGWSANNGERMMFGTEFHSVSLDWFDEVVLGAAYGGGHFYFINNFHIMKLTPIGDVVLSRATDFYTNGTYYRLWYDSGYLYRMGLGGGNKLRLFTYDAETLETLNDVVFGYHDSDRAEMLQFAVYGDLVIVGWATRYGAAGGELHYEHWRVKNFNVVQPVPLAAVVGRHMSAAGVGPAFRDLSELVGDYIDGYRIADVTSARGKLGPLQVGYLFDFVEYGYTIKAVKRGGSPVLTIPLADLGARAAGDSPGVLVRRERETDSQLPSYYSLTYLDYNREYDTSTQDANYPSRTSNSRNQNLPIVFTADKAAQLADVLINLSWMERDTYQISLPQKFVGLKPADIINVEIAAGLFAVMRVSAINYAANQRLEISAKRAEPAVYQSAAVGVAVLPPSENIPLIFAADCVLLDLPALNDATTGYGFGAVMSGGPNWIGGALLRSVDNGQAYDAVQGFAANCTVARATNFLTAGDYFVIDRASELFINVSAGEFFSVTESQMLTGKNYCAYGADGRWEIIQYANAEIMSGSSLKLSVFVRGLFGTEWAGDLHQNNDLLVLLDDPDTSFIGADAVALNSPRKFKGVTTGQDAQLATEIDFTYRGVNLKPLSPVNPVVTYFNGTYTVAWSHRTRFQSSQWSAGVLAAMGEKSLNFSIDIYNDSAVFIKTYEVFTPSFTYSAAQQLADFGYVPSSFSIKIYQVSEAIGRSNGLSAYCGALPDAYASTRVLLCHFMGANNSTSFVDSSQRARAITAVADAKISTARFLYGPSSALFDGTGDRLSIAASVDFLFDADFTIETFIYINADSDANALSLKSCNIFSADNGTNATSFQFYILGDASVTGKGLYIWNGSTAYGVATSISKSVWHHVAVSRSGSTLRFFLDGVQIGSNITLGGNLGSSTQGISIASRNLTINYYETLNGNLYDLRVTKGRAEYVTGFTVPAVQLPNP